MAGTGAVTILHAWWLGEGALEVAWRDVRGAPGERILFPSDPSALRTSTPGRAWGFGADVALFQLALEAQDDLRKVEKDSS